MCFSDRNLRLCDLDIKSRSYRKIKGRNKENGENNTEYFLKDKKKNN